MGREGHPSGLSWEVGVRSTVRKTWFGIWPPPPPGYMTLAKWFDLTVALTFLICEMEPHNSHSSLTVSNEILQHTMQW